MERYMALGLVLEGLVNRDFPAHVIARATQRAGKRLRRREHVGPLRGGVGVPNHYMGMVPSRMQGATRPLRPWLNEPSAAMVRTYGRVLVGNLEPQEFKFWIGARLAISLRSMCRCCGEVVYGPEARRAHLLAGDCGTVLERAYARLLEDRLCVVCDVATAEAVWGIPLHRQDCKATWMWDEDEEYNSLIHEISVEQGKALKYQGPGVE